MYRSLADLYHKRVKTNCLIANKLSVWRAHTPVAVNVNGDWVLTGIAFLCSGGKRKIENDLLSHSSDETRQGPKKPRLVFTDIQRRTLHAIFKETKRPSKEMQQTIAQQLGLEVRYSTCKTCSLSRKCYHTVTECRWWSWLRLVTVGIVEICSISTVFWFSVQSIADAEVYRHVSCFQVTTVANFFMNARRRSVDKWKDEMDRDSSGGSTTSNKN